MKALLLLRRISWKQAVSPSFDKSEPIFSL
jgi:hypothetical protein